MSINIFCKYYTNQDERTISRRAREKRRVGSSLLPIRRIAPLRSGHPLLIGCPTRRLPLPAALVTSALQ